MVALMKSLCFSFIVLASFATLFSVADAKLFKLGGNGAWVVNPQENYTSWAKSRRFQVNDILYFKYAKGSDSVQVVAEADYDACNVKNPKERFDSGEDEVALNRPGSFYFISGNEEHCTKGQKLIVVVLGNKNQPKVPVSPAKAPSSAHPPKAHSPVSPISPAKPPSKTQPPKAHSPVSPPSKAPSPSNSPSSPPSPKSPSPAAPPKPSASSPPKPPPSSPDSPAPSSPTPSADNNTAPAPSPKSAATVVTVSSVMSTLFGVAFTVLMFA